jgi:hypothetical protein
VECVAQRSSLDSFFSRILGHPTFFSADFECLLKFDNGNGKVSQFLLFERSFFYQAQYFFWFEYWRETSEMQVQFENDKINAKYDFENIVSRRYFQILFDLRKDNRFDKVCLATWKIREIFRIMWKLYLRMEWKFSNDKTYFFSTNPRS